MLTAADGARRGLVLFAPETFNLGETTRAIALAQALDDRHNCVFMGYHDRFVHLVEQAGYRCVEASPRLSDRDVDLIMRLDQGRGVRHPFDVATVRARVRTERGLVEELRPDAVVIGSTMTMLLSCRAAGVPLVYLKPFAYSRAHLERAHRLPVALPPGLRGGRRRVALERAAARLARVAARRITWKPRSFRVVAAEIGVRLPRATVDALDGDVTLYTSLSTYRAHGDGDHRDGAPLPEGHHAVGPVYARSAGAVPQSLLNLAGGPRPLVYLSVGSSGDRRLALRLLAAVSPVDVEVVAAVGRHLRPEDRARLPAHVHVHDHLPAHLVADLVAASVVHGGEGTVQTACSSGSPFVGIGLQAEQRWNLEECVALGNAIRIDSPRQARRALEQVLRDPAMKTAAQEVRHLVRSVNGPANAAAVVDGLVPRQRNGDPT